MEETKMKKTWIWIAAAAAVVLVIAAIALLSGGGSSEDTADRYENQPYLGEESAEVKIVEFGDYKCPYCKDFESGFFPLIDEQLIQTGDVKFYFIQYPFINADSDRSAEFAEVVYQELGNDTFWEFHELMYEKQEPGTEQQEVYTEDYLYDTLAEVVSEEEAQSVLTAYQDGAGEEALDRDLDWAGDWDVTGTPTLFVNGEKFEGSSIDDLVQMVEEAETE
ncbi:thioredoxin domain-containing protein [Halobacillus halophilus]|nr:thioredoxin domain-containing protein [Halobacillus halophilus]